MNLGNDGYGWLRWAISFVVSFVLGVGLMSVAGEILHRARAAARLHGASSMQSVEQVRAEPVHAEGRAG